MSDIAFDLLVVLFVVSNTISFILGYKQREMEYRNAENNFK